MAAIRLENITKRYGNTTAIDNLNLEINDGEFFCILGPPGAGKTTLLRLIVGLEAADEGNIYIDDELVNTVHPSRRDISMIFQNLALYPDKTVFDNIAFPLRQRKMDKETVKLKVVDVAKQLKIDWMLKRLPSQLSGGERQRVAIGRAIVRQPKAFLMDEPLANLDALLRLEMRVSLKKLQSDLKKTFAYVTHDQVEALSMGDRIAILNLGVLEQVDDPETIYRFPEQMFAATMLGNPPMNFMDCSLETGDQKISLRHEAFAAEIDNPDLTALLTSKVDGTDIVIGIRPEDITIYMDRPDRDDLIETQIFVSEPLGNETIVDIRLGHEIIKILAEADFPGVRGNKVWIEFDGAKFHLFHKKTGKCHFHASAEAFFQILKQTKGGT
jgi:multiple sugar transport system ATP-binding protein